MRTYQKIKTVYSRDPDTKFKTLIKGKFSRPEFELLKEVDWLWDEKIDGTNIRVMWEEGKVSFAGKTDVANMYPGMEEALQALFTPKVDELREIFEDKPVCLYGEGYGAGIQKVGKLYSPKPNFILFDILIGNVWLRRADVKEIAKRLEIDVVPEIAIGSLSDMVNTVRNGFRSKFGDFTAEGIVARPVVDLCDRMGRRIITKIKHKDFSK